jgi:hypothetical protein
MCDFQGGGTLRGEGSKKAGKIFRRDGCLGAGLRPSRVSCRCARYLQIARLGDTEPFIPQFIARWRPHQCIHPAHLESGSSTLRAHRQDGGARARQVKVDSKAV